MIMKHFSSVKSQQRHKFPVASNDVAPTSIKHNATRPKKEGGVPVVTMKSTTTRVLSFLILSLFLQQQRRRVCVVVAFESRTLPTHRTIVSLPLGNFIRNHGTTTRRDHKSVQLSITSKDTDYGEDSRRFRRTYYNNESWLRHRSSDRLIRNFTTMVSSGIFRQLLRDIGVVAIVSMGIILWNCALVAGFDDLSGHHHGPLVNSPCLPILELPRDPFVLSSPALGLLLVFRTDTSYARWDEARKAWGTILNHSRNIMRTSSAWVTRYADSTSLDCQQSLDCLGKAVWAFPRSLQRQLFGAQEDELAFQRDVRRRLDPQQAEALIKVQDKPSRALHDLSKAINALPLDYLRRMHIDQSVVELVDALGACERIYSSPVPLVYTRHTARFVTSWMFLLPFALWEPFESTWNHLGMVPSSVVIAFFLFGIEELAVQLEEPFSILPLEEIVNRIDHCVSDYQTWNYQDDLDKQEPSFIGIDGSKIESERLH